MIQRDGCAAWLARVIVGSVGFAVACTSHAPAKVPQSKITLRVGIGPLPSASPQDGLLQLIQNLSLEPLVRFTEDGRPRPGLAKEWSISADRLRARLTLHDGLRFHDGTKVRAEDIASSLSVTLPRVMGPAFTDVKAVSSEGGSEIDFALNQRSPFLFEALETTVQKPGTRGIGTGPYIARSSADTPEMWANHSYYLGTPTIERIVLNTYATTRAAWADMLRGKVDMLYEVGVDAIDSLEAANTVKLFTFTRHYQLMIVFNPSSKALASPTVRRALNSAIDRDALTKEGLGGFGEPSFSPIWPHHWAYPSDSPGFSFDATRAVGGLPPPDSTGVRLRFECLVPEGATYERIALVVRRQLANVGVELRLVEVPLNELVTRLPKREYEAALVEGINAPTMFRPYEWWHSGGSLNIGQWGNSALDEALDQVRHSVSNTEYRAAVKRVHKAVFQDPPAIFLAWPQRARAVSNRFTVPAEPARDVLPTLRLWKAVPDNQRASRN
jgi:peptide/nickel transport system substrate-binding protein